MNVGQEPEPEPDPSLAGLLGLDADGHRASAATMAHQDADINRLCGRLEQLTRSGTETGASDDRSWLSQCAAAVRSGNVREADALAGLLDEGQEVAAALAAEPSWPGAADQTDERGNPRTSAAKAVLSVAYLALQPAGAQVRVDAALTHWQRANVLVENTARDYATLVLCALCGNLPEPAPGVRAAVVFGGQKGGSSAMLTLAIQRDGPPGLYPDPRSMTFLTADEAFAASLEVAWHSAPALHQRCVIWDISDGEQPIRDLPRTTGGSLGAAFGVALHDLARANRPLGRVRMRRLDRACAITGDLSYSGKLGGVVDYEEKFSAAAGKSWRVVAPDDPEARKHRDIPKRADFVPDLNAAIRKSRRLMVPHADR